jgi:porin
MDGRRLSILLLLVGSGALPIAPARAQPPVASAPVPEGAVPEVAPVAAPPAENPFAGDFFNRSKLTGDWGGARSALAERGVKLDIFGTQFYQGVARGGREQSFDYGGRLDFLLNVDGQKLGLWQGLFFDMHAESRFAEDVNANSGLIAPPNLAMNFPAAGREVTSITGLKLTQALSERFVLFAGKLNTLDAFPLRFNPAGTTGLPFLGGFQSSPLVFNPIAARTVPYSAAGAGFAVLQDLQPLFSFTVLDPLERATKGADDLFTRGVTLVPDLILRGKPFGRPALLNVGGTYSSSRYRTLDPATYLNLFQVGQLGAALAGGGPLISDSWSVYVNGYQSLWVDPNDENRNWGVFAAGGISDGNPNPIKYSVAGGVGGRSMIRGRELDTFGVGYYYLGLSDQLKRVGRPLVRPIRDEFGVELFYNAALTPWCRFTPNFTVARPGVSARDTVIITGLRLQLAF